MPAWQPSRESSFIVCDYDEAYDLDMDRISVDGRCSSRRINSGYRHLS